MEKKATILAFLLLLFLLKVTGQISSNTSGLAITSISGKIDYSIGEVFFIQKGTHLIESEGAQQGLVINPSKHKNKLKAYVYPNPTKDLIYFKVENLNYTNLQYSIITEAGNEIIKGVINSPTNYISLINYPAGAYIIKMTRPPNEEISISILKIN